ncbi:MAG: hypothetical protein QOF28_3089 [Actinomycetota bacterium]|nr:hypothetical protein [Actinomycetota bacterium]
MNEALATSQLDTNQAPPLVNAGAVVGGTAIGLGLAAIAATLWTAEAFAGAHRIFYDPLAWWFGGTLIGAAFIGSLIAAVLSTARGPVAGLVNGLAAAGAFIAIGGAVALAVVANNGGTSSLVVNQTAIGVELVRPYAAFWSTVAAIAAGGLMPRPLLAQIGPFPAARRLQRVPVDNRSRVA